MTTKKWALSFLLLTSTMLAACGFHLRGSGFDLHQTKVWLLTQTPNEDFERALTQRLETQGGQWVKDAAAADLQLAVVGYQVDERVVARDSQGRASEVELIFTLDYRLAAKNQNYESDLAPLQSLSSRREYAFNRNLETGQEVEKRRLILDMQQQVISRLLLQIAKTQ
ncbi:LPS assembly lipoprotein LptE [Kangiella sp. TOML190]|uniref:LPS-assembly lipoprotein LptE n=1 Tax=Kangiella sp. TOML190 TaxID=2931351 RepID=UPI0020421651|nr:LPS assembly lipoprotein LptE [Kangiella sp. TOML190]